MKNLKFRLQYFVFALLVLFARLSAFAQITPSQDAYINTASAATNFGTAATLGVVSSSSSIQTTYIQFDLSPIPSGYKSANVAKATLKLFVNSVSSNGSFNVDLVNGSWSEKTITADLLPALGTTIKGSVPLTSASVNDYITVDLTTVVGEWLNGTQANDGIALVPNSPLSATFQSKENTSQSHPAELDIVFTNGATLTGITTGSGSGLTGGGTSGTPSLSLLKSCAANQVLQWNGSAWVCATVSGSGSGTITGVTAGTGLTGGGTSGNVTLSINPSAPLNAAYLGNVPAASFPVLFGNNNFIGLNSFHSANFLGNGETATIGDLGCDPASVGISFQGTNCTQYALLDFNGQTILNRKAGQNMSFREGNGQDQITLFGNGGGTEIRATTGSTPPEPFALSQFPTALWVENDTTSVDQNTLILWSPNIQPQGIGLCWFDVSADFFCAGSKSAVVPVDEGKRDVALYAVEAPENWFEDYGGGTLVDGAATVNLDPLFAQTVNTGMIYRVFVTPKGDCRGLYVTNETPSSFEVHELGGGKANIEFDYRIIAKRKGFENIRMADKTKTIKGMREHAKQRATSANKP